MNLILKPIIAILLNAGALYMLTDLVDSISFSGGWKFFLIGGGVLGIINLFVKPLLKLLSLPLVFVTGGLFLVVINMAVLYFLNYIIEVIAFQDVALAIPDLQTYLFGAIILGILNWLINLIN